MGAVVVVVVARKYEVHPGAVEQVLPRPAVLVDVARRVAREHGVVAEHDAPVGLGSGQLLLEPVELLGA
jgi:hypothetical protein